jgi:hypothetical protein
MMPIQVTGCKNSTKHALLMMMELSLEMTRFGCYVGAVVYSHVTDGDSIASK